MSLPQLRRSTHRRPTKPRDFAIARRALRAAAEPRPELSTLGDDLVVPLLLNKESPSNVDIPAAVEREELADILSRARRVQRASLQEVDEVQELLIVRVAVEWADLDSGLGLERKCRRIVVHYQDFSGKRPSLEMSFT